MKRREFFKRTSTLSAAVAIATAIGISRSKSKRVLKITGPIKDHHTIIGKYKNEIKSAFKEIEFKDLKKDDTFFIENDIQDKKFNGPFISTSDAFTVAEKECGYANNYGTHCINTGI